MPFAMRLSAFLGRVILGLYFLLAGIMKLQDPGASLDEMRDHGIWLSQGLLPISIFVELAFGAALILGYRARVAAFVLALYTVLVSLLLHNFWSVSSEDTAMALQLFYKNMGLLGGLLFVVGLGAGPWRISFGHSRYDDGALR